MDGRDLKINFSSGGGSPTRGGEDGQRSFSAGPRGASGGDGESTTIFVGNLGFRTDQNSLTRFFSDCGDIKAVRIAMGDDGRPKGFAHVEFETHESAKTALDKNG